MTNVPTVTLNRDCEVVQIPAGTTTTLPRGTSADITQSLGGTYTLHANGTLYRVSPENADALGLGPANASPAPQIAPGEAIEEKHIWEALRTCYDPEIPVNIVDLGLIYDLGIAPLPSGNHHVFVKMTLTAPGCGMGPTIARDAQQKLLDLPTVEQASVEIVWDPPWHQSMITEAGRKILGLN